MANNDGHPSNTCAFLGLQANPELHAPLLFRNTQDPTSLTCSVKKVLSPGRQCSYDMHPLCQVHNALKTLPASEEILRADLELRCSLFDAASALQLKKVASADVALIGKRCNTLLVQDIALPLSHCLEITKRVACVASL